MSKIAPLILVLFSSSVFAAPQFVQTGTELVCEKNPIMDSGQTPSRYRMVVKYDGTTGSKTAEVAIYLGEARINGFDAQVTGDLERSGISFFKNSTNNFTASAAYVERVVRGDMVYEIEVTTSWFKEELACEYTVPNPKASLDH